MNGPAVTSSREWSDYDKYLEVGIYERKQESKKGRKQEFEQESFFSFFLGLVLVFFLVF